MAMLTASLVGFLLFLYTMVDSCFIGRRIQRTEHKLNEFKENVVRRDSTENLNAGLWYPDLDKYKCINDPDFTDEKSIGHKISGFSVKMSFNCIIL